MSGRPAVAGFIRPSTGAGCPGEKVSDRGGKIQFLQRSVFPDAGSGQGQPPLGVSKYVVVGPLEEFELKPDLVLFLCNPAQASRLVTLSSYETGIPVQAQLSSSTCGGAVTIPLSTGRANVTFLDCPAGIW